MQPCPHGQEGLRVLDRRASCGGDATGGCGGLPSTKKVTAGCGAAHPADSELTTVKRGSQYPEQHEEGGDPQANRREREAQSQPSVVPGQSSG